MYNCSFTIVHLPIISSVKVIKINDVIREGAQLKFLCTEDSRASSYMAALMPVLLLSLSFTINNPFFVLIFFVVGLFYLFQIRPYITFIKLSSLKCRRPTEKTTSIALKRARGGYLDMSLFMDRPLSFMDILVIRKFTSPFYRKSS